MVYSCKFLSQVTFESDFGKKTFYCVTTFSVATALNLTHEILQSV